MPKIKLIVIYVLAFFILVGNIFAQPISASCHKFLQETLGTMPSDPHYQESKSRGISAQDNVRVLENGLRVIIKEDHSSPIVVFSAFIDIGSAFEEEYLGSGLSHLTEHMLFKGTKKYPPGAIEDILHKYGGEIEGWTSYDYTGYSITILKEHADIALDILKEILTCPTFNPKELKKEMDVIEREMALNRDDPYRRLSMLAFSKAYTRHPYRIPIIGYKENFKRLGRSDLVKFFRENYTPERLVIAVVGDIDKNIISAQIEDLFAKIPRGRNKRPVLPAEPEHIAPSYTEEKMDIEGAYLNIAFQSTQLLNKDLYAMDILSFILGQGESSILNEELRIKKELVVSVSAYNYTPEEPGLFIIPAVLKAENVNDAIAEILKQIDRVKVKGITDGELEKVKNNFLTEYIYREETIESQANDLALGELMAGNPNFFDRYIEYIKSVTSDDVQQSAKKYLNRENMTAVVLSGSGKALNLTGEVVKQKEEREIKKIILKNNLPVLISENRSLPIVSLSMLFKGGTRIENEQNNGISRLTSLMIMDGMERMTREEIALSYESKGMSLATFSANNSLGISVDCLKEHLDAGLELISNLWTKSIFPESQLQREKNELTCMIDMQDNDIVNHGHRILKERLFKNHPYRFQTIGTHESIGQIERKDIVKFQENIFSADNIVLGIAGDCNIENVQSLVDKYFSLVPQKTPNYPVPPKEMPLAHRRKVLIKTDKEQSLILLGFHGVDIYSKDRFPIEVMVESFSSESGILATSIREKRGLSYAQGGFQVLGMDPGYIAFYVLTSKENINKAKETLFKEIGSFIKKGMVSEDLERSKNHLKASHQIEMQRNAHFVFETTLDELYGLGYNNYKDYDRNIDSVTKEDVIRVAKKYLTLDRYAEVILEGK